MKKIVDEIDKCVNGVVSFLSDWLKTKNGFERRSFYGETFSLALLADKNELSTDIKKKLLNSYEKLLAENSSQLHWEFNNYAISDYYFNTNDNSVKKYIYPLVFKGTTCTNWTLLRCNVSLWHNPKSDEANIEAKRRLKKYQLKSGLILDDKGVKSFQYHCFSAVMCYEIYINTKDLFFLNSFIQAVIFIRRFILPNGETLYIGRGQNQSFGYSSLIYLLSLACSELNDVSLFNDIENILYFLSSFQNDSGSIPLVLNTREVKIPEDNSCANYETPGWYAYNNYFDYLPFFAYFLNKSQKVLRQLKCPKVVKNSSNTEDYSDKNFRIINKAKYIAILSRPGGYWTNDIPIPLIFKDGEIITPYYGGEQFVKSIYRMEGIPIPVLGKSNISLRKNSFSFFHKNYLILLSLRGIMIRAFYFSSSVIVINTRVFSLFTVLHNYLSKQCFHFKTPHKLYYKGIAIRSSLPLIKSGKEYSAIGALDRYCAKGKRHKLIISFFE